MLAGVDSPGGGLPAPPPRLPEEKLSNNQNGHLSSDETDRHAAMAAAFLSAQQAKQQKSSADKTD